MSEKPEKSESEADTQAGSLPEAEAGAEVAGSEVDKAGAVEVAADDTAQPPATPAAESADETHGKKPPKNLVDAIIKGLRPKQWVKNVLVLAAPLSAGAAKLFATSTLVDVAIAFVAFCFAASSIYLINEAYRLRDAAPEAGICAGSGPDSCCGGGELSCVIRPWVGDRDGGVYRVAAGLLLRVEAPAGD